MVRIGVIIQARTGSTRLPNKVLMPLPFGSNIPSIEHTIRRAKKIAKVNEIIIATTKKKQDDPVARIAKKLGVRCFRGSERDVLSRYYLAAKAHKLDMIIRLTGDNPCIDPSLISAALRQHLRAKNDFTGTTGYPIGMNTEIFTFAALEEADARAKRAYEREHVTPYIYSSHPERFRIGTMAARGMLRRPEARVTMDTIEDYTALCSIFDALYGRNRYFSTKDIIKLLDNKPWIAYINRKIVQKKFFTSQRINTRSK